LALPEVAGVFEQWKHQFALRFRLLAVDREADIFIYDRMETACVVIFDPRGRKFVFAPEQISAIEAR
jgi:hypothetical protein